MPRATRGQFSLTPTAGYLLSPLLVTITTWFLYHLQAYVASQQNGSPTRPYGIVYVIAVWMLTALAGRGPGVATLVLSVLALYVFLVPPVLRFHMPVTRNIVELVILSLVGSIMIAAQDAYQRAHQRHMALMQRDALINKLGVAIRSTLDPEHVPEVAAEALGEALGVDRCYFTVYNLAADNAHVGKDWHRSDLPSLAGDYRSSDFSIHPEEFYRGGEVLVVSDLRQHDVPPATAAALEALGIRSGISAPIISNGRLAAALTVAMAETTRTWTPEDVAIVSSIAALTRSALGLAQVHQRETNIASVLQGALMPTIPDPIPGLDIAPYYKACLDEANVGGDFFDVIALDKGTFALAVGDVSGKGLAAASQVATLRNMLRFTLYTEPDLAAAVDRLNRVLVDNSLLAGFATLAVAVLDTGARKLTYVSCGQDPLLLRRESETEIIQLDATGPVIGVNENAQYTSREVDLQSGDAVVIYTDGLTECGPDRRHLLGVDGLAYLVKSAPRSSAGELTDYVVQGAAKHANGTFTDDICMLVGIVTG